MANPWDSDPIVQTPASVAPATPWANDPPMQSDESGAHGAAVAATSGYLNGVPILGPALQAIPEYTAAGINTLLNGAPFSDNLARAQGVVKNAQAQHPYVTTGANVVGAVANTAPAMMAAPEAFGIGSGPILGRMGMAALTGGGIGGTDAAVRSGLDPRQTAIGATIGAVAGAAGPPIGKAIGAGVRYFTQPSDAISDLSSTARNYIQQELADPSKLAAYQADLARLGPEATLADVSPEWMGVARGAASRPGMRDAIVQPLLERQAAANARLATDLDSSLGPAVIPSQVEEGLAQSRNIVGQQYAPVMENARAVSTEPLAQQLEASAINLRGPEQQAVQRVRGFLNIPGTDVLDPNPQALLSTRQAIDGLMANEQNPQVVRQLTMARQQVDEALAAAAPGIKSVDAQYAELARQSDALQQGRPILNNQATALRPEEVQNMLQQGALPQGQQIGPSAVPTRLQQGVRAEIDRAAGTNAIDTTALRNIVRGEGDWNRAKLGMLFGQDNADRALNAIDRETTFGQTANRVTAGSDTAMANRFGGFLDDVGKPTEIPGDLTTIGVAARSAKKVANALLEQRGEAQAAQFANDLGRVSIATGTPRDQLVQALMARAQRGGSTANPGTQALINAVLQSAGRQALR